MVKETKSGEPQDSEKNTLKSLLSWLREDKQAIVFGLIGPVVGIVVGALYILGAFLLSKPVLFAYGYGITLLITVVFHVGSTAALMAKRDRETKESIQTASNEFKGILDAANEQRLRIKSLSGLDAERRISRSLKSARIVKNTYVNLSGSYRSDSRTGQAAINQYCDFLEQDVENKWYDITTIGDIAEGRYKSCLLYTSPSPRD